MRGRNAVEWYAINALSGASVTASNITVVDAHQMRAALSAGAGAELTATQVAVQSTGRRPLGPTGAEPAKPSTEGDMDVEREVRTLGKPRNPRPERVRTDVLGKMRRGGI